MMLQVFHQNLLLIGNQSKNTDLKPRITLRDEKGNVLKKLMIMKQDII